MYKLNNEEIGVYVVSRKWKDTFYDVILRNYTKNRAKCLGCFKSSYKANEECKKVANILEFLSAEKLADEHVHFDLILLNFPNVFNKEKEADMVEVSDD